MAIFLISYLLQNLANDDGVGFISISLPKKTKKKTAISGIVTKKSNSPVGSNRGERRGGVGF
jgi:hypothetical protein